VPRRSPPASVRSSGSSRSASPIPRSRSGCPPLRGGRGEEPPEDRPPQARSAGSDGADALGDPRETRARTRVRLPMGKSSSRRARRWPHSRLGNVDRTLGRYVAQRGGLVEDSVPALRRLFGRRCRGSRLAKGSASALSPAPPSRVADLLSTRSACLLGTNNAPAAHLPAWREGEPGREAWSGSCFLHCGNCEL
jgi:hypothetical protein